MTVTLRAIHLVNEGSYLVTRDFNNLEVDGIPVTVNNFVVSDPSSIVHILKHPAQITHYVNDQGDTMSKEDFLAQKGVLLSKGVENEEWPGEYTFHDLDDEYAFRRFCKTWEPVLGEEHIERGPVELEITEVRTNSGDPDIHSLWNAPGAHRDSCLYSLNRRVFTVEAFKKCCESRELSFTLGGSKESGIRFAKIGGNYLNFDDMDYSRGGQSFIGTLEQCKTEKERLHNRIVTEVNLHIAKHITKVGLNNAGAVLNDLVEIGNLVDRISPMKVSYSAYNTAIGKIRQLQEKIRNDMLTQVSK
jgi:hypothetical protein